MAFSETETSNVSMSFYPEVQCRRLYSHFMEEQSKRRQKVKDVCREYNKTGGELKALGHRIMVDNNGKFMFCNNYKVIVKIYIGRT